MMIKQLEAGAVKRAAELFARRTKAADEDARQAIDDLHRKIGQLQVKRDPLSGQPAISQVPKAGDVRSGKRSCPQADVLLGVPRNSLYYRPRFGGGEEVGLLKRLDRISRTIRFGRPPGAGDALVGGSLGRSPTCPAPDQETRPVGRSARTEHSNGIRRIKSTRTCEHVSRGGYGISG